jgi:hypothetical protein
MKAHADRDSRVEEYPTNSGAAPTVPGVLATLDEDDRRRLRDYKGGAAILYDMRLISIQLTTDDMHGHQWHLSMVEILSQTEMATPPDRCIADILECFFSKTLAVPNPGKIKEIVHFVGND